MKVLTITPEIKYPYLAVWVGKEGHLDLYKIEAEDIVLISMINPRELDEKCDKQPYIQHVLGGKEGYFTKHEDEYCALPNGYSLELHQEFHK